MLGPHSEKGVLQQVRPSPAWECLGKLPETRAQAIHGAVTAKSTDGAKLGVQPDLRGGSCKPWQPAKSGIETMRFRFTESPGRPRED